MELFKFLYLLQVIFLIDVFGKVYDVYNPAELNAALEVVNPGDKILLNRIEMGPQLFHGTFKITRNGTQEDPILLLNNNINVVNLIYYDYNQTLEPVLDVMGSYWEFHELRIFANYLGIRFIGANFNVMNGTSVNMYNIKGSEGIVLHNSSYNTFKGLYVDRSNTAFQILGSSSNNTLEDSNISDHVGSNNQIIIGSTVPSNNNILRRNKFDAYGAYPLNIFIDVRAPSSMGTIEGNHFLQANRENWILIGASNYTIQDNIFEAYGNRSNSKGILLQDTARHLTFKSNIMIYSNWAPDTFCIYGNADLHIDNVLTYDDNSCKNGNLTNLNGTLVPTPTSTTTIGTTTTDILTTLSVSPVTGTTVQTGLTTTTENFLQTTFESTTETEPTEPSSTTIGQPEVCDAWSNSTTKTEVDETPGCRIVTVITTTIVMSPIENRIEF